MFFTILFYLKKTQPKYLTHLKKNRETNNKIPSDISYVELKISLRICDYKN